MSGALAKRKGAVGPVPRATRPVWVRLSGSDAATGRFGHPYGWHKPFAIEVTQFVKAAKHTLVIRAHDMNRMGGIWKGVELIAE